MMKKLYLVWLAVVCFLANDALQADEFEKLPDELIVSVLSKLQDPADVLRFGQTSKRHHAITEDNQVWSGLFLNNKQAQKYIAQTRQTENKDLSHKDLFISYCNAIKNFKLAKKEAWFVIEARLLSGYYISITYETLYPPHGGIWTFSRNDVCDINYLALSKCDRDPRNENICLLAEKDFKNKELEHNINITCVAAFPTSQNLRMLFLRGQGEDLSISRFHKIVVEQVKDTQNSSFLAGAWLKLSVEPLRGSHADH